jgi:hypothetical protein
MMTTVYIYFSLILYCEFSLYVDYYDARTDEWWNVNIILDYYCDYLSLTERKTEEERQRSRLIAVTIWWTTTRCRGKSITHIYKNVCTILDWINLFFLFDISNHHFFLLSFGTTSIDTRDFFSFLLSLFIYIVLNWPCTWPLSLSFYYDTLVQDKNVDGYWMLNEI